jgi:tetratricopeptide (TPR) repeat protein
MTLGNHRDLYAQAQQAHRAADNHLAIELYSQLVSDLLEPGKEALQTQPDLRSLLADAGGEFVAILRWEGMYDRAIGVQERLVEIYDEREAALRMHLANLRIEGGDHAAGLLELREMAEMDPANIWGWIALATAYLWAEHEREAEETLRRAADMEQADDLDRAWACKVLFDLFGMQKRVHEAIEMWERMCQLDPALRATLPELYSMLIYRRHFEPAQKYLRLERSELRRIYYGGLIDFKNNLMPMAMQAWSQVLEFKPDELTEGHDEFASAGVRVLRPSLALEVLEPMLERGEVTHPRLVVAGLAWAQKRVLNRAQSALDVALRTADLERPRRTRPGGERRILDARARILYAEVRLDRDIRQQLDRYFIPGKS